MRAFPLDACAVHRACLPAPGYNACRTGSAAGVWCVVLLPAFLTVRNTLVLATYACLRMPAFCLLLFCLLPGSLWTYARILCVLGGYRVILRWFTMLRASS
jgi:hypothetical protein